jgi:hypothetical protein
MVERKMAEALANQVSVRDLKTHHYDWFARVQPEEMA